METKGNCYSSSCSLTDFLSKDGEKLAGIRTMKQEFRDAVKSHFENVLTHKNYNVATTIDPCFKTAFTAEKGCAFSRPVEEIITCTDPTEASASTKN